MSRDYKKERDAVVRRWYGGYIQPSRVRHSRNWNDNPISPSDCFGIPVQVNSPFNPLGHCMVWKYGCQGLRHSLQIGEISGDKS